MKLPAWVTRQAVRSLAVNTIAQLIVAAGAVLGYREYGPAAICVAAVVGGVLPTTLWFYGMHSWGAALDTERAVLDDRKAALADRLAAEKVHEAALLERIAVKTDLALIEEKKLSVALETQELLRLRIAILKDKLQ